MFLRQKYMLRESVSQLITRQTLLIYTDGAEAKKTMKMIKQNWGPVLAVFSNFFLSSLKNAELMRVFFEF